jgi:hypothetical protein
MRPQRGNNARNHAAVRISVVRGERRSCYLRVQHNKMDRHPVTTMRGFSLLDCICSLGVTSILALVVVRATQTTATVTSLHIKQISAKVAATKAALVASAALASLERSHLAGLVQISEGTNPLTSFGSPHPVSGVTSTSRPRSDSAIITSVELDPRYQGRVLHSTFSGESLSLEACQLPQRPSKDQFRSYLAIGLQGACQVTGTLQNFSESCVSFSGSVVTGLFTAGTCQPGALLEFVPITREYSLFIDRTGILRLVSHVGMRILENQPIGQGFRSLAVREWNDPTGAQVYQLSVTPSGSRPLTFFLPGALTRSLLWNEVLL